ncbi:MAG: hypothetical protein IT318_21740 [Anaerolineales bacterium]|nr:hypothetical protein [Anaerolineales bacterium]
MNPVINWVRLHPRLAAWLVLALGMNAMVVYEARNVGLLPGQWLALVVATTLVAGLCVWIIGWEDDEEEADEPAAGASAEPPAPAAKKE